MLLLPFLLLGCRLGTPDSDTTSTDTSTAAPRSLPSCDAGSCVTLPLNLRDLVPDGSGGAWGIVAGSPPDELWPEGVTPSTEANTFLIHLDNTTAIDIIESLGDQVEGSLAVSASGSVLVSGSYRNLRLAGTDYDVPSNGSGAGSFLALREPSGSWHAHQPWVRHHEAQWQAATLTAEGDLVMIGWAPTTAVDPTLFGHVVPVSDRPQLLHVSLADGVTEQAPLPEFLNGVGIPGRIWRRDGTTYGAIQTVYGGGIAQLDGEQPWIVEITPWLGHNLFELHTDPDADGHIAVSVWVGNSMQPYHDGGLDWTDASGAVQQVGVTQTWQDWQSTWVSPSGEVSTVATFGGRGVATFPSGEAWHAYIPSGGEYGASANVSEWCRLGSSGTDCTPLAHQQLRLDATGTMWAWSRGVDGDLLEVRRP